MLFEDETILRLFPPLRAKWAWKGTQPIVRISGANSRRVLFGTVNPRTGHRVLMRGRSMRQAEFQAFLRLLHQRYHGHRLCLILDEAGCHIAKGTNILREKLGLVGRYSSQAVAGTQSDGSSVAAGEGAHRRQPAIQDRRSGGRNCRTLHPSALAHENTASCRYPCK